MNQDFASALGRWGVCGYGLVTGGVAAGGMVKPLVDGAIDQDLLYLTRGLDAVLPCRAAVVPQDPQLCARHFTPLRQSRPEWLRQQRYAGDILSKIIRHRRSLTGEIRDLAGFLRLPL